MIKYPTRVIMFIMILFFINIGSAVENVKNGNFTDYHSCSHWTGVGCPDDWTSTYDAGKYWGATHTNHRTAPYSCVLHGSNRSLSQDVDLTDVNTLTFYTETHIAGTHLDLYIDGDFKERFLASYLSGWDTEPHTYDISSYSGVKEIKFMTVEQNVYIDDVSVFNPNSTIHYNPNIPISNTKPFNLSYTLNNTYSGQPLYPCFIYSYRGTDISSNDTPHIIWLSSYEGYVNLASGNFVTSNYFHHYDWTELNRSYGVVLYNPNGRTSGYINFDTIENDPNFLAKDQIYVNYSYNKTPPTYPSPQPTPNMTELPTPTGSPTPGPSTTPQPDPESINESLNTSFKQGYSNLVNTTIDGFYEPVYNFTYYIASPLLGLNDTLYNFSTHMNESFTNSSSSLVLSSSILFLIMTNIPDKLINVMTYYLIWLIVLLIFKGDA